MRKLIDILFVQFINLVAKIHKAPKPCGQDNPTRKREKKISKKERKTQANNYGS